jgi:hypothetical protein
MLKLRSSLSRIAANIGEAKISLFLIAVAASEVFTSCVSYRYTYELVPAKHRTTLTKEEIVDACGIVDQIAREKGVQPVTSPHLAVLRDYEKDQYIFPIGEDFAGFSISLISGGQGLEFGTGSSNPGDILGDLLERETLTRMGARFGTSRILRHAYPYSPRIF